MLLWSKLTVTMSVCNVFLSDNTTSLLAGRVLVLGFSLLDEELAGEEFQYLLITFSNLYDQSQLSTLKHEPGTWRAL